MLYQFLFCIIYCCITAEWSNVILTPLCVSKIKLLSKWNMKIKLIPVWLSNHLADQVQSFFCHKHIIICKLPIAFLSYVRAYMAYPTDMRSIFQRQHLHLGHIAKSFGLREVPTTISKRSKMAVYTSKRKWRQCCTKKRIIRRKHIYEYWYVLFITSHHVYMYI